MPRGFILQPTYRLERGHPVVHLYGVLEGGASFLVRDDRQIPHFYVRERDAARARGCGARVIPQAPPRATMDGEPVARVEVTKPPEAPRMRDRLKDAGIPCYEADVRFAYRYLIDHGIRGTLSIEGDSRRVGPIAHVFRNPVVAPADWSPTLSVLSIDIETDPRATRILSIALAGCGASEVLLLMPGTSAPCPPDSTPFTSEKALLEGFVERVRACDPDVITGWNVIDFDLAVLQRVAKRRGVKLRIGRGGDPLKVRPSSAPRRSSQAQVVGRVVLDGIDMMRGAFMRMESFALNAVAGEVLGERKLITGTDRAEEIIRTWREDLPLFTAYNLKDADLVLRILTRLRLIELAVERSRLTGMPPDRVAASIASFDFLYLSELGARHLVAPCVGSGARRGTGPGAWSGGSGETMETTTGGHVLEPVPGLHRNVLVFDFKSLYPSVIRTFQIDPAGWIRHPGPDDDLILAPNGAAFRREPGILPRLLDGLFPRREAARRAGDAVASQAIKILMNSFYGVLGTSACRFADPALANAITGLGRAILLWSKAWMERKGHRVLYGDTDSLFVEAGCTAPREARRLGESIVTTLNAALLRHVRRTWRVTSRLELEFDRLYLRLLLPAVRHGTAGARKRYAGLVETTSGPRVVFTGMEAVRRDWTDLARTVQRELYARLFADRPVHEYLQEVVAALRAGRLDDQLVYRKSLRKPLEAYTASTPPHVAAARRMSRRPGRVIRYVMTREGAEPSEERRSPIDHEHYVQKQVRPVAEPVLTLLALEFDRIIGDETQGRLFS